MNKCNICNKLTKNKVYCSFECRDEGRKIQTYETRKCSTCNCDIFVRKKSKTKYCSLKCSSNNKEANHKRNINAIKTNVERYGVEYAMKSADIKNRLKDSILEKYGVEYTFQSEEVKDKIKKTISERYGVDYPQQSNQIKEKTKKTVDLKYGGFTYNSKELTDTVKNTMIERYGVDSALKSEDLKNKVKKTNIERYGVEWGLSNDMIRDKIKKTINDKYGDEFENISQVPEFRDKINNSLRSVYYEKVKSRIPSNIAPLFDESDFDGVGYYDKLHSFYCNDCQTEFQDYLYAGHIPICRTCNPVIPNSSKIEEEIFNFIKSLGISAVQRIRSIIPPKELDIYIPEKQIAIEFNGLIWHSERFGNKPKTYHIEKTKLCEEKGIHLIHILEDEWLNKQNIVKYRLKNILGVTDKSIYARNCEIIEISIKDANRFLNEYHIQSEGKSSIRYGAFYNNELVAVMTFGKPRLALGNKIKSDNVYEMVRFCIGSINVVGIADRLFKTFIKKYKPMKVISYADRRWTSKNNVYDKLGFKLVSDGSPNYWYFKKSDIDRYHRFNFRKDVLNKKLQIFNSDLTEWENMQLNGYDRIWDCGSLKYEWTD
jgi:hypothetical protein